ncbi:MAG TPA: PAS domain-containing protein [Cytophagaceae bacterium]|jgi:PAS domain S-box-containing protein|nr:PAS domain-containing protein [Cytophagaceae bacterium]
MENKLAKMIDEYETKIIDLGNRLKNTIQVIEKVNEGDIKAAKDKLGSSNKEYAEFNPLASLIEKSAPHNSFQRNKDDDKTYAFLKIIIENMPFPVFIKDEMGTYILVNTMEADLFGLTESEIIGKHDSDFVIDEEEMEIIRNSDEDVLFGNKNIELPNQKFSLSHGRSYVFKTHKTPFINPISGKKNILGFSIDVSDTVNLDKLQKIVGMFSHPYL